MKLTPGSRWHSAVCDTEVVVIRPPKAEAQLECGGAAMLAHGTAKPPGGSAAAGRDAGTLLGKRYGDEELGLEVLCTKAGKGTLAVDGRLMALRATVALPSSD